MFHNVKSRSRNNNVKSFIYSFKHFVANKTRCLLKELPQRWQKGLPQNGQDVYLKKVATNLQRQRQSGHVFTKVYFLQILK